MSSFSSRWRALAAAARRQQAAASAGEATPERMRAIAMLGLARRHGGHGDERSAGFREWNSLALAAGLLLATGLGLWWADLPLAQSAGTLAHDLAELPRHVPRAPRLPSPAVLLAELDDLTSLHWNDPASLPGSTPPSAPETRP
jgi:hypothetical protein